MSAADQCTEARFLKDVATHRLSIIRDDGVNRHLRFRQPESYNMGFDLITWPGYLCYCGDMGTYVFTRIEDMFQFFRTDRKHAQREPGRTLYTNLSYWSEKCVASARDGITEFSKELFREAIERRMRERDEEEPSAPLSPEIRTAVDDEVLAYIDDGPEAAMRAACEFECDGFHFSDFWETRVEDYTYRFRWCCFALAWGIEEYDKAKQP